ncbi:type I-F CRISPR-associated protein Csy2 [Pseudomonas aeruginosa]|uniref:type I-F CRISPR-associated protein Csy2 n=1 Tax=Pseudomonas aeruginosa TaxID=287 RepID=UPI0026DEAD85|nr:type I-F CRISPR-associated protein Csy2 [Pseudomonas aeruginosa]MDO6107246.1 type I-F CRISPR-associated protein Csy2 [Pseudomonas aeruginosa]
MTRANWTSATAWPDRPPPFHPWKLFCKAYPAKSLSLPLYPTIFSLYPSGLSHSLSPGWLVPIPAGYNALSPLYLPGEVRNARDRETPLRFVENLFGLGEWLSPHRVAALSDLLWYHHAEPDKGLYRWSTPRFVEHAIA